MTFIDQATVEAIGGNGGNGCRAFRREKFVPRGGPSGGDGGHGGSVYLVGERNMNTLQQFRYLPRLVGERGRHGEGSNCTGRSGEDALVKVPLGTVAINLETEEVLGEVVLEGQRLLIAQGGRGGRGNARFATATNRAPRHTEPGEEGQYRRLRLELKLLADVGLVGLPNAGKSTLISVLSAARPKIADYPFTTLVPQLGVVAGEGVTEPFVIADIPGLIAGAAQGAGLGLQFLRHVERCRVLVHLVDLSGFDPLQTGAETISSARVDFEAVEAELAAFNPDLLARARFVVGSKADAQIEARAAELRAVAEERGLPYLEISSASHQGLDRLRLDLQAILRTVPRVFDETVAEEADPAAPEDQAVPEDAVAE